MISMKKKIIASILSISLLFGSVSAFATNNDIVIDNKSTDLVTIEDTNTPAPDNDDLITALAIQPRAADIQDIKALGRSAFPAAPKTKAKIEITGNGLDDATADYKVMYKKDGGQENEMQGVIQTTSSAMSVMFEFDLDENTTTTDQEYKVWVKDDSQTAVKSPELDLIVKATNAVAVITKIAGAVANQTEVNLASSAGNIDVIMSGANLGVTSDIKLRAMSNGTEDMNVTFRMFTLYDAVMPLTVTLPANTASEAKVYEIQGSVDGGTTWETDNVLKVSVFGTTTPTLTSTTLKSSTITSDAQEVEMDVEGTNLTGVQIKGRLDGATTPMQEVGTGTATKRTFKMSVPENTTNADITYKIDNYILQDNNLEETPKVDLKVLAVPVPGAPAITSVTATPDNLTDAGGTSKLSIAGTDLSKATIKVRGTINNADQNLTVSTVGAPTDTAVEYEVEFPANVDTTAKDYKVEVSLDNGTTWHHITATVTVAAAVVQPPVGAPTITSVTATPNSLTNAGGPSKLSIVGTDLSQSVITHQATINNVDQSLTFSRVGTPTDTAVEYEVEFPANVDTTAKTYTVQFSFDNGATWETQTATVTVAAAVVQPPVGAPTITSVTATPNSLTNAGGKSKFAIAGTDLSKATIKVQGTINNVDQSLTFSRVGTPTDTAVEYEVEFPANVDTTAKTYTVQFSFDNGATWETQTATVTVEAVVAPPVGTPAITSVIATPTSLTSTGGKSKFAIAGTDLSKATIKVQGTINNADQNLTVKEVGTGTDTAVEYEVEFPANRDTTAKTYTIKVSLDNGTTWDAKTATVTVAGKSNSNSGGGSSNNSGGGSTSNTNEVLDKNTISDAINMNNVVSGQDVVINSSNTAKISTDALQAVLDKNVNLIIDMGKYKWTIKGNDIDKNLLSSNNLAYDLNITRINESELTKLSNNEQVLQFEINHNGAFAFNAELSIFVDEYYKGKKLYLSYYNPTTGKLELQGDAMVDDKGYIKFNFNHASKYVLTTVLSDSIVRPTNVTEETVVSPSKPTSNPQTGDSAPNYMIVITLLLSGLGLLILSRKYATK